MKWREHLWIESLFQNVVNVICSWINKCLEIPTEDKRSSGFRLLKFPRFRCSLPVNRRLAEVSCKTGTLKLTELQSMQEFENARGVWVRDMFQHFPFIAGSLKLSGSGACDMPGIFFFHSRFSYIKTYHFSWTHLNIDEAKQSKK